MKKFYYLAIAASLGLGFTACSSEEPLEGAKGDGMVTITAQLPAELASRTFAQGEKATTLTYAVYESGVKTPIITSEDEVKFNADLTATVNLQLVNGKTYDILFWADAYTTATDAATTPYKFDAAKQTVTVDYTRMASNEDKGDAFFFAEKGLEVKGAINKTIYLTRPFAQINFGTDDLDAAAVKSAFGISETSEFGTLMSKVDFTKALPDCLNLFDGSVSTVSTTNTGFDAVAPTKEDTFPYSDDYGYLSMSYVLCGADRDIIDINYKVLNSDAEYNTLTIASVPVQRNYRTNIYGSLLTSKVNFKVEIKPGFTDNINVEKIVETADELLEAVKEGGNIVMKSDLTVSEPLKLTAEKPVTIELNGNDLTLNGTNILNDGQSLSLKGSGTEVVNITNNTTISPQGKANLDIDGIILTDNNKIGGAMITLLGDDNVVTVKNTVINVNSGSVYAISTNAAATDKNSVITLENVSVKTLTTNACPVLFNVPNKIVAKDCYFEGCNQAIILRGGDYEFTNCEFHMTLGLDNDGNTVTTKQNIKDIFRNYLRDEWKSGNRVPLAAMTIGNKGNSYQYPTTVKLTNCKVTLPEVTKMDLTTEDVEVARLSSLPAVYVHANQGEGLGVTFTYDAATTFDGELEYASTNITVNGNAITTTPTYENTPTK